MTETTDIKALRERMMQQREAALTGNTPSFEDCELLVCDLLRALNLSNKHLEAERQRADELLKAEHAVSDAYVRLRQILGAMNPPELDFEALTSFTEQKAKELAALRGEQEPVPDVIRDANRYRFLRDEDAWGEDSDSWDVETRTGLISSRNLLEFRTDDFDAAIDARMAASDIPFFNPVSELFTHPAKPVVVLPDRMTPEDVRWYLKQSDHDDGEVCRIEHAEVIGAKMWNACIDTIEAAGIVVKDGE